MRRDEDPWGADDLGQSGRNGGGPRGGFSFAIAGSLRMRSEYETRLDADQQTALAAVIESGSFDAAAELLHVTPSAGSQRIKALEPVGS